LQDDPKPGRPRTVDRNIILTTTLTPPPKRLGVTHWSSRLLADQLKVAQSTVLRTPSADGGFEEFCELVRSCASRSATRTFNAAFSNRRVLSSARISTISSTNSTYVGCDIPQLSHSHQPLFRETPTLNPNNPANVGWNSFTCRADQLHLTSYTGSRFAVIAKAAGDRVDPFLGGGHGRHPAVEADPIRVGAVASAFGGHRQMTRHCGAMSCQPLIQGSPEALSNSKRKTSDTIFKMNSASGSAVMLGVPCAAALRIVCHLAKLALRSAVLVQFSV